MSIDSATGLISWVPTQLGEYPVTVSVTDGIANTVQSFTIYVTETGIAPDESLLAITDFDIKVDGESDKNLDNGEKIGEDARPLSELEFSIEVKNLFNDGTEIEDVSVTVKIPDVDDGDDLEEDSKEFNLDDGEDDSVSISLKLPLLIEEAIHEVIITVQGEDDYGKEHETEWILYLEVDKERHDLMIHNLEISPQTVRCDRYATVELEVANIGSKDEEDVVVKIQSHALEIDIEEDDIELEHGTDEDDSVYDRSMQLSIGDDVEPGPYTIDVKTYRDHSKLMDSGTVELLVEECAELKKKDVDVQLIAASDLPQGYPPAIIDTEPIKISFKESDEYLMLLAIGTVILLGLVVYGIGAVLILYKK
jgi:hypothetical protein